MLKKQISVVTFALWAMLATAAKPVDAVKLNPLLLAQSPSPSFPMPESLPKGTTVKVDGSSSLEVINQNLQQKFKDKYPDATLLLQYSGTDAALAALREGKVDLAAIGRSLTPAERQGGLTAYALPRQKIAIITGPENAFNGSITFDQFAQIFRGEITDWSQLGGEPGPIRFVDRPEDSDTRRAFQNYDVFRKSSFATGANAVKLAEDSTAEAIAALGKDGISYAIANQVLDRNDVRIVPMHKTTPDNPSYPFSQPIAYVYRGSTPQAALASFLGYASSPDGQAAIAAPQAANAVAQTASSPVATQTTSPDAIADADAPGATSSPATPTDGTAAPARERDGSFPWWLLLLPLGLLGLWWLLKDRESEPEVSPAPPLPKSEPPVTPGVAPPPVAPVGETVPIDEPPLVAPVGEPVAVDEPPLVAPVGESVAVDEPSLVPPVGESVAVDEPPLAPPPADATVIQTGEPDRIIPSAGSTLLTGAILAGGATLPHAGETPATPSDATINLPADAGEEEVPPIPAPNAAEANLEPDVGIPSVDGELEPPANTLDETATSDVESGGTFPVAGAVGAVVGGVIAGGAMGDREDSQIPIDPVVGGDVEAPAESFEGADGSPPDPWLEETEEVVGAEGEADNAVGAMPEGEARYRMFLVSQDFHSARAHWEIPEAQKQRFGNVAERQMGVRLCDVTGIDPEGQEPHSWQHFDCTEETESWNFHIPESDRDYLAELGYLTPEGEWLVVARSHPLHVPNSQAQFTSTLERTVVAPAVDEVEDAIGGEAATLSAVAASELIAEPPSDLWVIADVAANLYGATTPGATIKIDDREIPVETDGSFNIPLDLSEGALARPILIETTDGHQSRWLRIQLTPKANLDF